MTRKEAVKVIENMTFMCDDTDYDVMSDAVSMAIEALEYLEKNEKWIDLLNIFAESCDFDVNKIMWNAQEWVPCSERLPKADTECLCCNDGYTPFCAYYDGKYWNSDYGTEKQHDAWMPLPEPYKAERREI